MPDFLRLVNQRISNEERAPLTARMAASLAGGGYAAEALSLLQRQGFIIFHLQVFNCFVKYLIPGLGAHFLDHLHFVLL